MLIFPSFLGVTGIIAVTIGFIFILLLCVTLCVIFAFIRREAKRRKILEQQAEQHRTMDEEMMMELADDRPPTYQEAMQLPSCSPL